MSGARRLHRELLRRIRLLLLLDGLVLMLQGVGLIFLGLRGLVGGFLVMLLLIFLLLLLFLGQGARRWGQ